MFWCRLSLLIVPAGALTSIFEPRRLEFPGERTYIELIARTEEAFGKRQYCEDQIDRVVTQLSARLANDSVTEFRRLPKHMNSLLFGGRFGL